MPRAPSAPKERKAARTRRRILDAAAVEFAEHGYAETSLRRVATASDLQLGSLYFHFESKELIAAEILREGIDLGIERISRALEALPSNATASDRLAAAIDAHIRALQDAGAKAAAVVRVVDTLPDVVRSTHAPDLRRYARIWNQLTAAAQDEGAIDPELDPRLVRELLTAAMNGTLRMGGSPAALADTLATLTIRRPRREAAQPSC